MGILGGTFNPPHLGHLAIARHAHEELALQRVLLMPAHIPPHKLSEEDPGPQHRLQMCRLCVGEIDGLSVCALEIERGGPSFTVDTLQAIHSRHPDAKLTFIVGADTASTLPAWREPARLLELADLAVAARLAQAPDRDALAPRWAPPAPSRAIAGRRSGSSACPSMEVSSSMARERVARGAAIEDLVGGAVAGYIHEHGLYVTGAES